MDLNRKENGRDRPSPLAAIFLLGCYVDVGENKIILAGNQTTPSPITVIKTERYETGSTKGYNSYGGSG